MSADVTSYTEDYADGQLEEVTVTVTDGDTSVDVTAEPNGSGLVLTRAYQHDTTLLVGEGFRLLREGIEALRGAGHDIDVHGLLGDALAEAESDETEEADETEDNDTAEEGPDPEYDSVEAYLQAIDEATVEEMAAATGQSTDGVHKELFEIPDERLNKRKDPDDGRRKLYSLQEIDGSPPGDMTEGEIVSVADHYTTLTEVAKDLEVSEDRARAILREHDVLDEVQT